MPTDRSLDGNRLNKTVAWRFCATVTTAFLVSQLFVWPLAFAMPVFAAMLIMAPAAISLRAACMLLTTVAMILLAGNFFAGLLSYPFLFAVLITIILFAIFSFAAGGGSPLLVVVMLVAVLLLPLVAQSSLALAGDIAFYVWVDMFVAILFSWLFFALIPARKDASVRKGSVPAEPAKVTRYGPLAMTCLVAPLALAFISFGWTNVITLLFSTLLIQQLSTQENFKGALYLLAANMVGVVLAIACYLFFIAAPTVVFLALLSALVATLLAPVISTPGPKAGLWLSAFNAFLIVLGASLTPYGDDAGAKGFDRVIQIGFACVYVSIAIMMMESLFRNRQARRLPA